MLENKIYIHKRCGGQVKKEDNIYINYPYYCPDCDENLYSFEVASKKINNKSLTK